MTYVTEQTPAELRAHMKRLKSLPSWRDPLSDRLWKEIQDLDKRVAELEVTNRSLMNAKEGQTEKASVLATECESLEYQVEQLTKERDQLAAQNDRLRNAFNKTKYEFVTVTGSRHYCYEPDVLHKVFTETPAASLAEIRAQAIEDFKAHLDKEYYGEDLSQFIEMYAEQIRQQAREVE